MDEDKPLKIKQEDPSSMDVDAPSQAKPEPSTPKAALEPAEDPGTWRYVRVVSTPDILPAVKDSTGDDPGLLTRVKVTP